MFLFKFSVLKLENLSFNSILQMSVYEYLNQGCYYTLQEQTALQFQFLSTIEVYRFLARTISSSDVPDGWLSWAAVV